MKYLVVYSILITLLLIITGFLFVQREQKAKTDYDAVFSKMEQYKQNAAYNNAISDSLKHQVELIINNYEKPDTVFLEKIATITRLSPDSNILLLTKVFADIDSVFKRKYSNINFKPPSN